MLSERFLLIVVGGGSLLVIVGTGISLISNLDSLSLAFDVCVLVADWYWLMAGLRLLNNGVAAFDESTLCTW
jgi:hypothetical protein